MTDAFARHFFITLHLVFQNIRIIKSWLENARFAATMQSLIPSFMAAVLAIGHPDFCWYTALLAVLGANIAHCGMNLLDDWFDYIDVLEARIKVVRSGFKAFTAKYPYLTEGRTTVNGLKTVIAVFGGIALLFGAICLIHWATAPIVDSACLARSGLSSISDPTPCWQDSSYAPLETDGLSSTSKIRFIIQN